MSENNCTEKYYEKIKIVIDETDELSQTTESPNFVVGSMQKVCH